MAGRHALLAEERKPKFAPIIIGLLSAITIPVILTYNLDLYDNYALVSFLSLAGIWFGFLLGYLLYKANRSKAHTLFPASTKKIKYVFLGFFGGILLQLALALLGLLIIVSFGLDPNELGNANGLPFEDTYSYGYEGLLVTVALIFAVAVGAPIIEELFFRGAVLPVVATRWGPIAGVIVSSIAFGAMHIQPTLESSLYTITMTSFAGVALAVARLKSKSLMLPIFMHMGFNSWALILVFGISSIS